MGREAVSKEAVFAAANELNEAKEKVLVSSVRAKIGRGSNTTIAPFVKEWFNTQKKEEQTPEVITELPPQEIIDLSVQGAQEGASRVWAIAKKLADEKLSTERAAMEQERVTHAEDLNDAIKTGDMIQTELEDALERIELITAKANEAAETAALEIEKQILGKTEVEAKAAALTGTVEALQTQIKELNKTLEQLRVEGTKMAERAANAETKSIDLINQINANEITISQLRDDAANQAERATIAETKFTDLADQFKAQKAVAEQLRYDANSLTARAVAAETINAELTGQVSQITTQKEAAEKMVAGLHENIGKFIERESISKRNDQTSAEKIKQLKKTIDELQAQLKK